MISAAVVILNYNGAHYLSQFLPKLIRYSSGHELIVADNGSTDASASVVGQFPEVQWLDLGKNHGFAEGYNQALSKISSEFVVLLNSDVEVTPNWIDAPLNQLLQNPKVGAIQPKIKSYHLRSHWEYAGAAGGWMDSLGYPFCRGRLFETIEEDLDQYEEVSSIFWASGACFFTRRSLFLTMEGFDPLFFAHMEEIDLCWRMQRQGWEILYEPQSTVFHVGAGTLQADSPFKTYLNFRNNLAMLYKNLPAHQLIGKIFLRLILDGLAGIRLALQGKWSLMWAIVRAHGGFYLLIPKLKRTPTTQFEWNGYWKGSVIWAYFFQKKKLFNQLFR